MSTPDDAPALASVRPAGVNEKEAISYVRVSSVKGGPSTHVVELLLQPQDIFLLGVELVLHLGERLRYAMEHLFGRLENVVRVVLQEVALHNDLTMT